MSAKGYARGYNDGYDAGFDKGFKKGFRGAVDAEMQLRNATKPAPIHPTPIRPARPLTAKELVELDAREARIRAELDARESRFKTSPESNA